MADFRKDSAAQYMHFYTEIKIFLCYYKIRSFSE